MTDYSLEQFLLAKDRYCNITGHSREQFLEWLTCSQAFKVSIWKAHTGITIHAQPGTVPEQRMNMLLSPHWYTLLKIQQTRQVA